MSDIFSRHTKVRGEKKKKLNKTLLHVLGSSTAIETVSRTAVQKITHDSFKQPILSLDQRRLHTMEPEDLILSNMRENKAFVLCSLFIES